MGWISGTERTAFASATGFGPGVRWNWPEPTHARRDSLDSAFGVDVPQLPYDPKTTLLPALKSGKIVQEDWPGYASRFAWGDPESPLKGLQWYAQRTLLG